MPRADHPHHPLVLPHFRQRVRLLAALAALSGVLGAGRVRADQGAEPPVAAPPPASSRFT